ncbi:two-component system OmpR family sensor kinase [Novosphingobium sp. PhB165]|uniref:HAMP domain-containing sensor histidine kinase n=1 Tax=Novosphingobium sp. PhB165 TaxID=2485105 RepID=UPI0010524214|nr:ATP-binding protein [Novosphingobium sp. PhB165]TCM15733.1 two-component system OmpR family sensor kinase [Novosphingobium sp. PhB165]
MTPSLQARSGRRLFWKILLSFLFTFVVMTQAVWLLFQLRTDREPPAPLMIHQIGPAVLEAGAQAIQAGGAARYVAMLDNLPEDQRKRLELVAPGQVVALPGTGDVENAVMERKVRDPAGTEYQLRFRYHRDMRKWRLDIPPELAIMGVVAGLAFSALLAWYLMRPINHLRDGFARLARGELKARVSPAIGSRRDEVADLGHDFDAMARRLEQLVESRDRLLHDVSHELRSPLARLHLAIALARQSPGRFDSSMDRMEHEVDRLDGLVSELLLLARAENEPAGSDEYFDLVGVVAEVVADTRYEAQPQNVRIDFAAVGIDEDQAPPVRGNGELLRRAIDNVMRNALRFSPPDSRIEVRAELLLRPHRYRVTVSDVGPGVPADMVDSIFEPFVRTRPDTPRPDYRSLGLGLAIASRAVAACHGRIGAANLPAGGLRVEIEIPAQLTPDAGRAAGTD